jgi:hypothetical protein
VLRSGYCYAMNEVSEAGMRLMTQIALDSACRQRWGMFLRIGVGEAAGGAAGLDVLPGTGRPGLPLTWVV